VDRTQWRRERRLWNEVQMDVYSRHYDEQWGGIEEMHQEMLLRFLAHMPTRGHILDAACGTGKYWSLLLQKRYNIVGIDQSKGMLQQAHHKYLAVPFKQMGLQEMTFQDQFDGVLCIDALENIFPEDWPMVLTNLKRALHPNGFCYFTVEVVDEEELQVAFDAAKRLSLPIVYGEFVWHGGYHYYPTDSQVRSWLMMAALPLVESVEQDGYRHYIIHT
jgi:ubiquinone/menaquinone biosynthesis C-methylase UbiE